MYMEVHFRPNEHGCEFWPPRQVNKTLSLALELLREFHWSDDEFCCTHIL